MSEDERAAKPAEFKDRTVGLIAFGAMEVLIGGFCSLMIPFVVFVAMMPQPNGAPAGLPQMLPMVGIYAMAAVFFIWIGIGSILARRWARAVMLVCSWIWLICGLMGMALMIWLMPAIFDNMSNNMPPGQQLPPEAFLIMQIFMGGIMGCMYILLPGAFVLFYRSPHVWATCQLKDPRTRWTDRCPLPVLGLVILFAYGAFCLIWQPFYNFVIPWFGGFLDGARGAAVVLTAMLVQIYLVWGMYRCKLAAWWTAVVLVVVGSVSGTLTMAQTDLMELYERMNMPPEQLDVMRQMGMAEKMNSAWWIGIPMAVVFLGYLVYVKRYFGRLEGEKGSEPSEKQL